MRGKCKKVDKESTEKIQKSEQGEKKIIQGIEEGGVIMENILKIMRMVSIIFVIFLGIFVTACGGGGDGSGYSRGSGQTHGGNSGATPGGSQDMGYIRSLIESGKIPAEELFHIFTPAFGVLTLPSSTSLQRTLARGYPVARERVLAGWCA